MPKSVTYVSGTKCDPCVGPLNLEKIGERLKFQEKMQRTPHRSLALVVVDAEEPSWMAK
jgi:hypothetical protein